MAQISDAALAKASMLAGKNALPFSLACRKWDPIRNDPRFQKLASGKSGAIEFYK